MNTVAYLAPFFSLGLALKCLAMFPWYAGLPLALMSFAVTHIGIIKYLIQVPSHDAVWKTPYFSSIFQSSAFWVVVTWMFVLVPCKFSLAQHYAHTTDPLNSYFTLTIHQLDIFDHLLYCHVCIFQGSCSRSWIHQEGFIERKAA